ncbi:MAG TPA: helix-turn-helix domain-containing protein, partial [Candidatus Bathyarchaeia archaeon]
AELRGSEDDRSLIEKLYVDPLPQEQIFRTILKPNTTFLIGRKGTGKSTIFQRLQYEILKSKSTTSAYIDIKTVFESSQVEPGLLDLLQQSRTILPPSTLEKLLLYKAFLREVIVEIKTQLRDRAQASLWERVKAKFGGSLDEVFEDLDALLVEANTDRFISVIAIKELNIESKEAHSAKTSSGHDIGSELGKNPNLKIAAKETSESELTAGKDIHYADVLMKTFDTKGLVVKLKEILHRLGVRHLYVLIDDFSELPEDAMRVTVDALLAPLNNWSDEFVKFKVAAYPGRVYYGQIDKTKIDEVYLDLFKLYGTNDVATMEEKATDFTRRLVERRLEHYKAGSAQDFFEPSSSEDIWKLLFFATMANPRILGYILHYLHETQLIFGSPIGPRAIRDATRRYYEEKIESYFGMNKFLHESFAERASIFSLKELLEDLVKRARELRSHKSAMMNEIPGRPPTSHFHVIVELENLLQTLELNFFLTKYFEMTDRDGRKVSVFAFYYGFCQKYAIEFGRPHGKREFRVYFIERVFDYTSILRRYMERNQEIVCESCGAKYALEHLSALQFFNMKCRECTNGTCRVINLSKRYEVVLQSINQALLLPSAELGILHTLHSEGKALFAAEIASELDCSYQLVGRRGKFLADRGLVERRENETGRRVYELTDVAEESYFSRQEENQLNIDKG